MNTTDLGQLNIDLQSLLAGDGNERQSAVTIAEKEVRPIVLRYLRSKFGAQIDLDDIWQDLMVAFLESANEIQDPVPWLFATARNLTIDRFRRSHGKRLADFDLDEISLPTAPWPDSVQREVLEILDEMENPERVILSLRFVLGWRLREISDALEMPVSTVSSRVFRGLHKLRERLNVDLDWS